MKTLKVSLKAIVLILATTATLQANATDAKTTSNNSKIGANTVHLAHAGILNSVPVVELSFQNPTGEKVEITIKDETGILVYNELYAGTSYSRKFLFEQDLADANPLVTVKYLGSNKTESYRVKADIATGPGNIIVKL